MQLTIPKIAVLSVVLVSVGIPMLAISANARETSLPIRSVRPARVLLAALRPALYGALAKGTTGTDAYTIRSNGCVTLTKQALEACFDAHGAHFTGIGSALVLHLTAWGRSGGGLTAVQMMKPTVEGNRASYLHDGVAEWWRVLPAGFEQGFTFLKRPTSHGKLTLVLAAGNKAKQHNGALTWGKLHYGDLVVTDAKGKVIPATLKAKGDRVLIAVNDAHAVYPLTVDPLVWIGQKVTASDGQENDQFGVSIAVSGSTALIGARYATVNGNDGQGAAYVFTESNGTWIQTQKLTANDGAAYDSFGSSVAFDGTTALIGAPDGGNFGQGAAYLFNESNGTWTLTQKFIAGDGAPSDAFGSSVAVSGTNVIIGALYATIDGNTYQGAAYVFTESDDIWTQVAKLIANDGASNNYFGCAVALSGTHAFVGAYGATVNGNDSQGAVYVFGGSDDWTQTQKLVAGDGSEGDWFGSSVAASGTTVLVGADLSDVKGNLNQGAAYVFSKSGGGWNQTAKLSAGDGVANDVFGESVALSGMTAIFGSGATVDGHPGQGAAYVFDGSSGTWTQTQKLTASDGEDYNHFGESVAVSGTAVLVGSYLAAVNFPNQGAAYFYGKGDLGLAVSAPQTVGQSQEYISQTIATNNSSVASPAVSATITVPVAASFVSATATQGSCSAASGVVTCDFGQIEGNAGTATANVTLKATGAPGTTIENTANIAKATPPLMASAATTIGEDGACPAGYTEFSGHLDAGGTFTSAPITVSEAGQKYVDLTSPASFAFFAITTTRYGQHTYVYPHVKHGHRWGAAGSYQVGVQAGPDAGGDYTLCVNFNPTQ